LSDGISKLRQELARSVAALARTIETFQRPQPMVQGSFYLLRRKCGNPNCRCATGKLHSSWVLTRSEKGKDRLYSVPKAEQARVRQEAAEYKRYHRARARLVKRQAQLLKLIDEIAAHRLRVWPQKKEDKPPA
jgi:hypothetical protein